MNVFGDALTWLGDRANYRGDGGILHLARLHIQVSLLALAAAIVIGLTVGVALGHTGRGGGLVTVLANVTRAIPTLGLLTILASISTFGVTTFSAVVALAIFAIPPILTNAWAGVIGVDRDTVEAAKGLGMSGGQILLRVELPLALPLIAAGLRSSVLQTFATATIASYVGNPTLGTLIQLGQGTQSQDEVLGAAIIIGIVAILLDVLLAQLQKRLTPGERKPGPFRRRHAASVARATG